MANRHTDTRLQTRLTSKGLQKRLLKLYFDARTLEEEQGVNVLYLALGTLKWIDPNNVANVRYAPLVSVPVSLERATAGDRFKLKWRQEDPSSNLSLDAMVDRIHLLKLPAFDTSEEFDYRPVGHLVGRTPSDSIESCRIQKAMRRPVAAAFEDAIGSHRYSLDQKLLSDAKAGEDAAQ